MLATCEEKICNLISDPIEGQRKVQVIPPEIKRVFDKHPEVILKGDWNISNYNLVEPEIHLKYDQSIKNPVPKPIKHIKDEQMYPKFVKVVTYNKNGI